MTSEKRTEKIINALHAAEHRDEVYNALLHVPHANLMDMLSMIEYILKHDCKGGICS